MNYKITAIVAAAVIAPAGLFAQTKKAPAAKPAAAAPAKPKAPAAKPAAPAAEVKPAVNSTVELKDPVAVINGEKITKAELEAALADILKANGADAADIPAESKIAFFHQTVNEAIMDKLIDKASEGTTIEKGAVAAEIEKLKKNFPSEAEFAAKMKEAGATIDKLTADIAKSLRQRQWVESQVAKSGEVSEAEVKDFYDKNPKEFEQSEQVKASHILFMVKPGEDEAVAKEKEALASKAIERLKKGEDFAAVAKDMTEEPGGKERAGDLGFFEKDKMVPEFSEAAFALKKGEISKPVHTQFGWHVIKAEDRKGAGTISFAEAKEQITNFLKMQKQRKAVGELLQSLREKASIEINLPPMPQQPMTPAAGE